MFHRVIKKRKFEGTNMTKNIYKTKEEIKLGNTLENNAAALGVIDILLYYLESDLDDLYKYIEYKNDDYLKRCISRLTILCCRINDDIMITKKNIEHIIDSI